MTRSPDPSPPVASGPRRRVLVDGSHRGALALPPRELLPDREPLPRILGGPAQTAGPAGPTHARPAPSLRHAPIAGLPPVVAGSRTERRKIVAYHLIDMSPSNQWTDPQGARHLDFAYLSREWASRVIPNDLFVPVLFDSAAVVYPACHPAEVAKDGWRSRPAPSPERGGTLFLPPALAVTQHARAHPGHACIVILYSDGLPNDVNDIAQASAVLSAAGIPAVLIPYGPDFPWISAHWEHTAFRIARHVHDRRRAIAQTVALAILAVTGHQRAS